jgi:putative hydrolase of the HAD superfamily
LVNKEIKAVVFDYGKVISLAPAASVMENIAALAGLSVPVMDALVWKYRSDYDRGSVTVEEYYRRLLKAGGVQVDGETIGKMAELDTGGWTHINGETVRLMEEIKTSGIKLGILSNMPRDFLALARSSFPVFGLPDAGVFSCEQGAVKPEAAIYRALIEALDCRAREIVFFDDMPVNVEGALQAGIRAFVWEGPKAARELLGKSGLFR